MLPSHRPSALAQLTALPLLATLVLATPLFADGSHKTPLGPMPPVPGVISLPSGMQVVWELDPVATGATPPPDTVNLYFVNNVVGDQIELAGIKPGVNGAADTPVQCDWYPGPGQCVYCPDDGDYLDPVATAKIANVMVVAAKLSDLQVPVNGLTENALYTVFMQYSPKGLVPGQCAQAYTY